jgi:hypothetical protein
MENKLIKFIFSKTKFFLHFNFFITFFVGMSCGIFCSFLIYLFLFLKNFNKNYKKNKTKNNNLDEQKMNLLIKETQDNFIKDIKQNKDKYMFFLFKNSKELILKVANSFFPNSNYPYLELNIEESLVLIHYIHNRIDKLFEQKILLIFKKTTLRQIFLLRKKIIEKKYISKFKKTNKTISIFSNLVNFINPFHWFKKIFFKTFYNTIMNKIGCAIILIIGEEVYKIYSKTLFKSEQNIENLLEELKKDLEKNKNQEEKKV